MLNIRKKIAEDGDVCDTISLILLAISMFSMLRAPTSAGTQLAMVI